MRHRSRLARTVVGTVVVCATALASSGVIPALIIIKFMTWGFTGVTREEGMALVFSLPAIIAWLLVSLSFFVVIMLQTKGKARALTLSILAIVMLAIYIVVPV
jgi:hypothetical protein